MTENEAIEVLEKPSKHIRMVHKTKNEMEFYTFSSDLVEAFETAIHALSEIQQYRAIGTIDEFKALKEKNEPKKAEYRKMVYPRHKWMEEDGKIDAFAYSSGYCNGPMCERCYYSFCEHCNPGGWEEECVVEDYICPSCGEKVNRKNTHCKCGQALDWQ